MPDSIHLSNQFDPIQLFGRILRSTQFLERKQLSVGKLRQGYIGYAAKNSLNPARV
jgi:hypothetical protein